jgi:hypothetical protein
MKIDWLAPKAKGLAFSFFPFNVLLIIFLLGSPRSTIEVRTFNTGRR